MSEIKIHNHEGVTSWWLDEKLHREDGPAVETVDGYREWYRNGELHREGGPAFEGPDGSFSWYIDGLLHREDGPAMVYSNGKCSWFINGDQLTEEEFNNRNNKEVKTMPEKKQIYVTEIDNADASYIVGCYEDFEYAKLAGLVEQKWHEDFINFNCAFTVRPYTISPIIDTEKYDYYMAKVELMESTMTELEVQVEELYSSGDFEKLYEVAKRLAKLSEQ